MRGLRPVLGALAAGLSLAACGDDPAPEREDRVARVTDGDTVVLERLGRTRLIGIDTPEVYPVEECFGRAAAERTEALLPPGTRVRYAFDAEERDRFGRALVYLYAERRLVNAELLRGGFATPLRVPPNTGRAGEFERLARDARRAGRGLWGDC